MEDITFETKCYEHDWELILCTSYLNRMLKRTKTEFAFKQLIINNVENPDLVRHFAELKVKEGVIDAYYMAEEYAEEVLHHFRIDRNSFGKGYYYSISELVGLYLSKTKYHLHFSSDARIYPYSSSRWIKEAIELMDDNPEYIVANPTWSKHYHGAKRESISELKNFYVGYGFSDQCYLVPTKVFRQPIYNETHPESERYPKYGGELFEKRVDSYMRNHELKRLTSKHVSYRHKNLPKGKFGKWFCKQKEHCREIIDFQF